MAASTVFAAFVAASLLLTPLPPPPPPDGNTPVTQQQLLSWTVTKMTCAGQAIDPAPIRRPLAALSTLNPQLIRPISYRFAIDATGRTLSIAREGTEYAPAAQDIGPSLAATRFPAGSPRTDCSVRYEPDAKALSEAAPHDLAAYSVLASGSNLPKAGWDRLAPPGNCRTAPRPGLLLRAYPDFSKLAATPGAKTWSLVTYDIDAEGRPVQVRIADSTGHSALDTAAVEAVTASRFSGGARTGCLYRYWRSPATLAPPEPSPDPAPAPQGTCPAAIDWAVRPNPVYPLAYRNRAIEGWAVLSFDLAPWGEVGNVEVVDAQPSADFGQQAMQIIRSGRAVPSPQGATACIETVKFQMPVHSGAEAGETASHAAAEEDPPAY